jgi:hypothetical protein
MNSLTKFYIEVPRDEYWNTGWTIAIIEAHEHKKNPNKLKVIAPSSFGYPFVLKNFFIECSGPAKKLTYAEYVELIHELIPKRPLPKGYKSKSTEVFHNTNKEGLGP